MIRRKFLQLVTAAGVGGLAPLEAFAGNGGKTATWLVKGFTCITCATGLDTLLTRQKGVLASTSTYPEGKVVVRFDPGRIDEQTIVAFIGELGFTVQNQSKANT